MIPTTPPTPRPRRSLAFQLAALGLVVVSALAATGLARWLKKTPPKEGEFPAQLFKGWEKPDFVIVLSGQQQGYLEPCGCSSPQVGGLERRYNLLEMFKSKGWPYAAVDLGDLPQRAGPAGLPNQQGMLKYAYSMRAHKAMGYSAVGFGEHEVNLGLFNVLAEFALNDKQPRVVTTNLMDAEKNFPEMTAPWQPVDLVTRSGRKVRLGVVSLTGPAVAARIKELTRNDAKVRFGETTATLDNVVKQLDASEVDLPILLYQGPLTRNEKEKATEASACAEAYPQFPIILCQSDDDNQPPLPKEVPTKNGKSLVITVGQKGKFVGVVGVWKTGKKEAPFAFKYERVEMTEDFMTPKAKRGKHPVVVLMEEYTKELHDKKYLELYGQVRHTLQVMPAVKGLRKPGEVEYAGSETCKKCHEHAYEVWKKTPHSHAYETLVERAKNPGNRQFDPECIVCHTVGFGYKSGYINEAKTPKLKDVGCESCHGPSSMHVKNPTNEEWQKRVNPWKYLPKNKREDAMDQMCQKCHDQDNDVTWLHNGFKRKWPKVEHMTPGGTDEEEKK